MAVIIGTILALFSIGVVIYPFIRGRFRLQSAPSPGSTVPVPGGGWEVLYDDIKTLQLEYELGSIEENDFYDRLRALRLEAAVSLRDQDRLEQELDRLLEKEISRVRVPRGTRNCRNCGQRLASNDNACPDCGEDQQEGPGDGSPDS